MNQKNKTIVTIEVHQGVATPTMHQGDPVTIIVIDRDKDDEERNEIPCTWEFGND